MAKTQDATSDQEREEGARRIIRDVLRVGQADAADEVRREAGARNRALEYVAAKYPDHAADVAKLFEDTRDPMAYQQCAEWLERALPSSPQRDFILRVLRVLEPASVIRPRDIAIRNAVDAAMEIYGFKKSRNPAQRYKDDGGHSACSLVAEELGKLGIADIGEDAVLKIYTAPLPEETISNEHLKLRAEMFTEAYLAAMAAGKED
jgi:hypothetical protein